MMAPFFIRCPIKLTVNKHVCYPDPETEQHGIQPSFIFLFRPVLFLLWVVKKRPVTIENDLLKGRKKKKGCDRGFSLQCIWVSKMRVWRKGQCEYLASQAELQRKLFLLQCNLGHNTPNTRRKVGHYIMQVRVFSSLLMQECECICVFCVRVLGQHMILHEPFFFFFFFLREREWAH